MKHRRIIRAVALVTAVYLVLLGAWVRWFVPGSPDGTLPFQEMFLLAGYGCAVGLAMIVADRRSPDERRFGRRAIEGWARIDSVDVVGRTADDQTVADIVLEVTIPGSPPYHGRVRYEIGPGERAGLRPGAVVPVLADPDDQTHLQLRPDLAPPA